MANSKHRKNAAKRARRNRKLLLALVCLFLVIVLLAAAYWYFYVYSKRQAPGPEGPSTDGPSTEGPSAEEPATGELSIHFLELGNRYTGDCIFIQTGNTELLIDGGSRETSADTIERYVDSYCSDGVLEYVIVTHADQDHIAAFAGNSYHESLFRRYVCETIIDFPNTKKTTQVYGRYCTERDAEVAEGAVHYTALECYNNENGAQRSYELAEGITLNFLYNYYYDHSASDENDYSVCFYIAQGEYNYLFTGDLEEKGEKYLVQYNELPQCKLFKAGHHGSKTSSTDALLSVIRPEYVCVCCIAGSNEYTDNGDNTFPTQAMIDRVARYTKNIYVTTLSTGDGYTSMNGNIVVRSDGAAFSVSGTNNSTILKDTDWFKANRIWPSYGV